MKIEKDTVASIAYTVTELDGKVVGRTEPDSPVLALIGHGFLVKGLEKALLGHEKGDEFAIQLPANETYGEYDETLVQTIDKAMFGDFTPNVGNVFEADSNNGPVAVVVKEVRDDVVVVDANHPLAGKTLNFLIEIIDVREASEEEIKHGHAHADGHCPSEEHHCHCHHHDHDDEDGEHECCHHHHHDDEDGEHECCHHHHHDDEDDDHECCHHHHHHHHHHDDEHHHDHD